MPTYKYQCKECKAEWDEWHSIHDEVGTVHCPILPCDGEATKVYNSLNHIGVGTHGQQYRDVEAREARWHLDMPAYKRFRDKGYQPAGIDGCDRLEATAKNELEIKTNGKLSVPDSIAQSSQADAQDIMAGRL